MTVTITNIGTQNIADLRYRRVMDWDIEPTPFAEWVTVANTAASRQLLFDSDRVSQFRPARGPGSTHSNQSQLRRGLHRDGAVLESRCQGGVYPAVASPADHGALFDFGFGALAPGK